MNFGFIAFSFASKNAYCTVTQKAHSPQTGRVNRIMDVGPHGKQHVAYQEVDFSSTHTNMLIHQQRERE